MFFVILNSRFYRPQQQKQKKRQGLKYHITKGCGYSMITVCFRPDIGGSYPTVMAIATEAGCGLHKNLP